MLATVITTRPFCLSLCPPPAPPMPAEGGSLSLGDRLERLILSDERFATAVRSSELLDEPAAAVAEPGQESLPSLPATEDAIPDAVLIALLSALPPQDVGRCSRVCRRWRAAATSEALWRMLCRRQIAIFHPPLGPMGAAPPAPPAADVLVLPSGQVVRGMDAAAGTPPPSLFILPIEAPLSPPPRPTSSPLLPRAAAAAPAADGDEATSALQASVALAHAQAASALPSWAGSAEAARTAYLAARCEMVAAFRAAAASARSFRAAFATIGAVRTDGFYSLRKQYIRSGIEDRFHTHEGILLVVYHRALRFRRDGSLVYICTAGRLTDVARQFARVAAGSRSAEKANIGHGRFELHGAAVRAAVVVGKTAAHWHLTVSSDSPGRIHNRLAVERVVRRPRGWAQGEKKEFSYVAPPPPAPTLHPLSNPPADSLRVRRAFRERPRAGRPVRGRAYVCPRACLLR